MLNDLALIRRWSPMAIDVSPGVLADAPSPLYRATTTVGPTSADFSCTSEWQHTEHTKKAAEEEACSRLQGMVDDAPPTGGQLAAGEVLRAAIRNLSATHCPHSRLLTTAKTNSTRPTRCSAPPPRLSARCAASRSRTRSESGADRAPTIL